ncbi:MAG: insulinase family protein [Anaerolineae bacterium]|nr:insulinase family protein [Anaerolineae bacterium]
MTTIHNFELHHEQMIPELNARARLYRHVHTGTQLLSLETDDENKVFGVSFKTPPDDSTGLPHIMEHSVLGGSRKYPVKEPFVELLKGSLKTFVNASTYPDKTIYPVASQNLQDFYNLVDVYLDAVFHPTLTRLTLMQEGWHYELDVPDAPLVYKGVVFNEMKGAYSDPENVLEERILSALFPDTVYCLDSGGDPAVIPDLTYEQFLQFFKMHYHPANALVYFYGDDPVDDRLRIVDEVVREFESQAVEATIDLQPAFDAPRRLDYGYAVDDPQDAKAYVTVNWVLAEGDDPGLTFAFTALGHLLVGTPASPLRKALIDSGLGEDLTGLGYEADLRQLIFSTGLKGVALDQVAVVEQLVLDTLKVLVEDGIEPDMIAATVNTIEFALRENNTGYFPRGIVLMTRALRTWLHGGDPLAPLAFEGPLSALKTQLAVDDRYFEGLIQRYLLDNPHRATVNLTPDPDRQAQLDAAERARLAEARAVMGEADVQQVIDDARALKKLQETPDSPEALATIPVLKRDDLDKETKTIPLGVSDVHGAELLYHDLFTNGIVYLDLGFNLHTLPQAYVPYMGVFGRVLLEMGTETEDYVKLSQRIGRTTGGIYPGAYSAMPLGASQATAWSMLRGKAMVARMPDLLAILRDVLLTAKLDNQERFRQIVLEAKAMREASLVPRGHGVIRSRLQSYLNEADWVGEQIGGVSYLLFLRQLADAVENDWPSVLARLEDIRALLLNRQAMVCNVTLDAENWTQVQPLVADFIAGLPGADPVLHQWSPALEPVNEGLTIPAQVNYVGQGADLYTLGYTPHGSIIPILNYLDTTWLWERVRVHGGAYGGFVTFSWNSGALAFLSYRDPNLLATLENSRLTGKFLRELELSQEELTKAIIGAIGLLDVYQLPDAKGYTSMTRHLTGWTDALRQARRTEVLTTTVEDFQRFGEVLDQVAVHGGVTVLGASDAIAGANAERGDD